MPEIVAPPPPPPFALTTSEGTPLRLASLDVKTKVSGPLASTEMRMRFVNETPRQLEGRFRIVLPQRSFVSRLAMKIDGRLREADVVELPVARTVYEETMHVRRDPLLVEQKNDNELTARVFPIPPLGDKEIVVGWVSEIDATTPITIPLRGVGKLDELDVKITNGDAELFSQKEREIAPSSDVRVAAPRGASAVRAGERVVARVRIAADASPDPIGRGLLVLLDTSASRAAELDATMAMTKEIIASLARAEPEAHLVVAAFDQDVSLVHDGPIGGFSDREIAAVRSRGALGASDIERALAWAAKRSDVSRLLFIGDGLATAGDASRPKLREAAARIGVERIDAIAVGDVHDDGLLRSIVRDGILLAGDTDAALAATRLRKKTLNDVRVAVPGARWFAPEKLDGVQDGDERFVYAEADASRVVVAGRESSSAPAWSPLADRAVAKAKIDALSSQAEEKGWDDAKRSSVIAMARKNKLASPLTGMIVLENEAARAAMEARRSELAPSPAPPQKPSPPQQSIASDDILAPPPPLPPPGATAHGRIGGSHAVKAPQLRMGSTMVNGRVPPEVIQRIVRQSWGRFRGCYLEGFLRGDGTLRGRVTSKIVIAPDGHVVRVEDAGSDLPDKKVIACVGEAFRGLTFPSNDWGYIFVVYPITFRPLGTEEDAPEPPPRKNLLDATILGGGSAYLPLDPTPPPPPPLAWTGAYAWFHLTLDEAGPQAALVVAANSHAHDLRDAPTLAALGEAFEAAGYPDQAARAYGSIADLEPHRADRLRAAAARLAHLGGENLSLAIELARRALGDRPDVPSSHHLLALTLLQAGRYEEAFDTLAHARTISFPTRMGPADRVFGDLLGVITLAWRTAAPERADEIDRRASAVRAVLPVTARMRLVVSWENDPARVWASALVGERHEIAYTPAWGAEGWGPVESFIAAPPDDVTLEIGTNELPPSGEPTMGVVHVLTHDGRGHVTVDPRPFVVMKSEGRVPLGLITPSSGSRARSPSSRDGS
jgi:hypothetical protein